VFDSRQDFQTTFFLLYAKKKQNFSVFTKKNSKIPVNFQFLPKNEKRSENFRSSD